MPYENFKEILTIQIKLPHQPNNFSGAVQSGSDEF